MASLKDRLAARASLAAATIQGALVAPSVFAEDGGDNPFTKIDNSASTFSENLSTISGSIAVACLVIVGLLFMVGDVGKRKAAGWFPYVIAGLLVIAFAGAIVTFTQGLG